MRSLARREEADARRAWWSLLRDGEASYRMVAGILKSGRGQPKGCPAARPRSSMTVPISGRSRGASLRTSTAAKRSAGPSGMISLWCDYVSRAVLDNPIHRAEPRQFGKLVSALRCEGADPARKGRPWSLPLQDRVLLVAAYWRTNLTLRQLAPL